jgi:hypothetical protein
MASENESDGTVFKFLLSATFVVAGGSGVVQSFVRFDHRVKEIIERTSD